jgi:hypothetical protein
MNIALSKRLEEGRPINIIHSEWISDSDGINAHQFLAAEKFIEEVYEVYGRFGCRINIILHSSNSTYNGIVKHLIEARKNNMSISNIFFEK